MKTNKSRLLLIAAAIALATFACSTLDIGSLGGTPGVLYEDNFDSGNSGWGVGTDEYGITDYYQGGFRIKTIPSNWVLWAGPGEQFSDTSITVDATKLAGPDTNDFGVICRYQDSANFYALTIGSDGYAGIWIMDNNDDYMLIDEYVYTDAINQGEATNTITADCTGDTLSLSVNGTLVVQATDTTFTSGDIALVVGTFDEGDADILFDNFVVNDPNYQP